MSSKRVGTPKSGPSKAQPILHTRRCSGASVNDVEKDWPRRAAPTRHLTSATAAANFHSAQITSRPGVSLYVPVSQGCKRFRGTHMVHNGVTPYEKGAAHCQNWSDTCVCSATTLPSLYSSFCNTSLHHGAEYVVLKHCHSGVHLTADDVN
eukprot:340816-Amphidinium_carterae.1